MITFSSPQFFFSFSLFLFLFSPRQISDLKRLNKIEKEIEIHARKTIKVPINAHTILLNTANIEELPIVHKSGQNSPHHPVDINLDAKDIHSQPSTSHQLPNNILDEKLLVASVSLAGNHIDRDRNGNSSHLTRNNYKFNKSPDQLNDAEPIDDDFNFTDPLIAPLAEPNERYTDEHGLHSEPHVIRGAPRSDLSCSGSDCDISWICLFIFILALCFAIPLIYVIYIAEHPEQFHHKENTIETNGG